MNNLIKTIWGPLQTDIKSARTDLAVKIALSYDYARHGIPEGSEQAVADQKACVQDLMDDRSARLGGVWDRVTGQTLRIPYATLRTNPFEL